MGIRSRCRRDTCHQFGAAIHRYQSLGQWHGAASQMGTDARQTCRPCDYKGQAPGWWQVDIIHMCVYIYVCVYILDIYWIYIYVYVSQKAAHCSIESRQMTVELTFNNIRRCVAACCSVLQCVAVSSVLSLRQ